MFIFPAILGGFFAYAYYELSSFGLGRELETDEKPFVWGLGFLSLFCFALAINYLFFPEMAI